VTATPEPAAWALAVIGAIVVLLIQYTGQMPGVASSTRFRSGSRK
jgi:hypothetical protein